jgi:hypothetical protein
MDGLDDKLGTILDVSGVHLSADQQTGSIVQNVTPCGL